MTDVMLLGVLRMPMPDDPDPMTLRQFVSRARQAADRIEADAAKLDALAARVAELERDAAMLQWLSDHITRKPADIGGGCMWMFVSKDKPANLRAAIDSAMGDRT